jgi:hypothetical protein
MSAPTNTRRTCDELGVCQAHSLRCARCLPPQPFAPGAITRHTSAQRKALVRALKRTALFMVGAVFIGLVAGLVFGAMK